MPDLSEVRVLTFDLFGTVLNLRDSFAEPMERFVSEKRFDVSPKELWQQWRYRQRIEQYQDTIMMVGHSGYLVTARRAFEYTLKQFGLTVTSKEVDEFMSHWWNLNAFPEVVPALGRLKDRYQLVALSNGDPDLLRHLASERIGWSFTEIISAEVVGSFKPHPAVYRKAASILGMQVHECMMVSANSFDTMGARSCGFRGAYVDRYKRPFEDTPYLPDIVVEDFQDLADALI